MAGEIEAMADVATASMLAKAAEPHDAVTRHHGEERCLNCNAELVGSHCHACGQAGHVHRTFGGFVHEIVHGVFHFEGKIWATLPLLAYHPGELTRRYIDGERARFVSPIALFLFSVFLMFTIVSNVGHAPNFGSGDSGFSGGLTEAASDIDRNATRLRARERNLVAKRERALAADRNVAKIDRRLAETRDEIAALAQAAQVIKLPAEASPRVKAGIAAAAADSDIREPSLGQTKSWLKSRLDHARSDPQLTFYKMKSAGYKYSWALIPLSLPFLWLMFFWRRNVGLYDHAVFATYSLSFMSLLVVVLTLVNLVLGETMGGLTWLAFFVIPPIHIYKQLRHGYRLGRLSTGWRTLALLGVIVITSTLFFMLLLYFGVAD